MRAKIIPKEITAKLKQLRPTPEYGWFWDDDQWLLLLRDPDKDTIDEDGYVGILPGKDGRFAIVFLIMSETTSHVEFDDLPVLTVRKNRDRDRRRIMKAFDIAGEKGVTTEGVEIALGMPHQTCAARLLEMQSPKFILGPIVRSSREEAKRLIDSLLAADTPDIL
jgi:hypothetical protein